MVKANKHFSPEAKKKILQLVFDLLEKDKVEVKRYGRRKIEFRFPIDEKNDDRRIYLNQMDLVQFFTTINSAHLNYKDRLTIVGTIKEGYVEIVNSVIN